MTRSANDAGFSRPRAVARVAAFFVLWLVIHGAGPGDFPIGFMTALLAAWVSLGLLPAGAWRARPLAVIGVVLRFMGQSLYAGVDVARRAMEPRPASHSGFVACRIELPGEGVVRSAFCAFESMMPGTLPAGFDESGRLHMHCLDTSRPVQTDLEADRRRLAQALGGHD